MRWVGSPAASKISQEPSKIARPSAPSLISEIARSSASLQSRCHSRTSSGTSPTTNVRVMSQKMNDSLSRGQMSTTIGDAGADRPGAHVVADGALRPGRDDELVGRRAVRGEGLRHRGLHPLDRQRLAVEHQTVSAGLDAAEQVAHRVHAGFGGALRPAHACELRLGLDAPAVVEEAGVDGRARRRRPAAGRRARAGMPRARRRS